MNNDGMLDHEEVLEFEDAVVEKGEGNLTSKERLELLKTQQDVIEQQAAQYFATAYQALVKRTGYEVTAIPQYMINPSTNVYELRMSYTVQKVV